MFTRSDVSREIRFRRVVMRKFQKILLLSIPVVCLVLAVACFAQTTVQADSKPDLSNEPTLFVVGYAHLDTEWRWEYPHVINEYLRKPMEETFALFATYPHYAFNLR